MRTLAEVKTADLIGPALDWAVAKAAEYEPSVYRADGLDGGVSYDIGLPTMSVKKPYTRWSPSMDWSQGGPLIHQYGCDLNCIASANCWESNCWDDDLPTPDLHLMEAETPLIAACRAIVAAKLGDAVQIPAELLGRAV